METIEQRLAALELHSQSDDCVPALVQVVMEHGRTPAQTAAAAAALAAGVKIVVINFKDARKPSA